MLTAGRFSTKWRDFVSTFSQYTRRKEQARRLVFLHLCFCIRGMRNQEMRQQKKKKKGPRRGGACATRATCELRTCCHGDEPTRSWSARGTSALRRQPDHAGYCENAPTLGKLRQKVRNRMVLTYNDVGHAPKCPQIGVLLNNRATKLAAFLLYKFGVR